MPVPVAFVGKLLYSGMSLNTVFTFVTAVVSHVIRITAMLIVLSHLLCMA
jgi:hypothetical protein